MQGEQSALILLKHASAEKRRSECFRWQTGQILPKGNLATSR